MNKDLPQAPAALQQAPGGTRKRVLFVDDEPLVLNALRRMLHSLRSEWDMHFVESGAQALELMARQTVDVVVSDMRMPGMNGAELLNRVMQASPRTVRLILSGHADAELILKCVGATHQYLAKPCDASTLRATVQRVSVIEDMLHSEALRQLTGCMDALPSLPSLYFEIVRKLQSPDTQAEEVADIIARDIGMTAKILKLVNSAFFGVSRTISSPQEAVIYLGVDTLKALALSAHAFSELKSLPVEGFSVEALWTHSLQTGVAARALARIEKLPPAVVEQSFTAGLLHDTGKLVFAAKCPRYGEALTLAYEESLPLCTAERRLFDATHAELGGYLLSLWGLPVPLVEAVALHHEPGRSPSTGATPLLMVHAANALLHELDGGMTSGDCAALEQEYLEHNGLAGRVPMWRETVTETWTPNTRL